MEVTGGSIQLMRYMKRVKAFKADTNDAKTILGAGQAASRLFVGFFVGLSWRVRFLTVQSANRFPPPKGESAGMMP